MRFHAIQGTTQFSSPTSVYQCEVSCSLSSSELLNRLLRSEYRHALSATKEEPRTPAFCSRVVLVNGNDSCLDGRFGYFLQLNPFLQVLIP